MTEKKKPTKQKTPPEVVFPEGMANAKKQKKNNLLIDWEFVDRRLSEGCSGTEIAASIGVCFRTLSRRCRKDRGIAFEELGQAMRAKGVAFAKSVFYRKAFVEKDTASAIFWMKNNAGWTDRRQVEQNVNVNQSSFEDLVGGVENGQTRKKNSLTTADKQRVLFERFRSDPKLWIERCLKIIDKSGREVPFTMNQIQRRYYEELIKKYWKPYLLPNGKEVYRLQGVREVNLKARQFGLSSLICAILLHDTIFFPGTRTWLFCQDDDASKTMLEERVKFYFNSINREDPLIVLPTPDKDNTKELVFATIASKISCRSPGQSQHVSRKKGRSITLRNALLSELEEWPYADELIQGLDPALNDPSTNIFIESSPNLRGSYFYRFYQMGKDPSTGWTSRFWPWYLHDEYQSTINSIIEHDQIKASLTEDEHDLIEHVRETWMLELSMEQIKWRRRTKASPTLATKGPMAFKKEYPEREDDCFETTGASVFTDPDYTLAQLTCAERPAIPGHIHSIGVDVADGAGGDYSVITVIDAVTREQIYQWRSNLVSSTDLHLQVYEVWKKYPGVVFIETNGIGRATIAKARSDMTIVTNPEGQSVPLCVDWDAFVHAGHRTYDGLPTLSEKSTTIYLLRGAILEAVQFYSEPLNNRGSVVGLRIGSESIIQEMPDYQNLPGGKLGAPAGSHDDAIMSLSVAFRGLDELVDYQKLFKQRFADNT